MLETRQNAEASIGMLVNDDSNTPCLSIVIKCFHNPVMVQDHVQKSRQRLHSSLTVNCEMIQYDPGARLILVTHGRGLQLSGCNISW